MATNNVFYPIPYRDTGLREAIVRQAAEECAAQYLTSIKTSGFTRPLFWNDFLVNGASSSVVLETGIVFTAVTASNATFNLSASAVISFTTPNNKVFNFYGLADYAANPVARVLSVTIQGTTYNPIYLNPELVTSEDKVFILNGPFRPVPPNTPVTLTIYGTAAVASPGEAIDILGFVTETPPSVPTQ